MNTAPAHHPRRAVLRVATIGALSLLSAAWLATTSAPACAADPTSFESAFRQFQRAAGGEEAAAEGAAEQFSTLSAAAPTDPVLLAYSGAATAMRARTTMLPWKKMAFADDGLARIDKALAQLSPAHDAPLHHGTPASVETRFVAANTFLDLPAMFNRQARGAKLLNEVLTSPLLVSSPLPFRGSVWLRAAAAAVADNRPGDARRWLEQVVSSGAPQAPVAQAKLKELAS